MRNLKEILKDSLTEKELCSVPSSFDIIGSKQKAVAIVEIPEELKKKQLLIANAIMHLHKNVKSVLAKVSARKGELRLREYELIAGNSDTEVVHKEYGYLLKLDPQKVYFSPREGMERQRIAQQVKAGEKILVMFSGCAPYAIAIAKKQPDVDKIYCIELNPDAHKYAQENVRINKLSHKIILICGDVKNECKKLEEKFDRIVMPLPFGSESFLNVAIACLKTGGIIHFYNWGKEPDVFQNAITCIEKNVKKYKILDKRIVLPYGPRKYKVCIDFVPQG